MARKFLSSVDFNGQSLTSLNLGVQANKILSGNSNGVLEEVELADGLTVAADGQGARQIKLNLGDGLAFETDPTTGQKRLKFDGTQGSSTLDGLTDVTITNPQAGQVLKYGPGGWVNLADSTGTAGITVGTFGTGGSDIGSSVTAIRFDKASGFSVVEGPGGTSEARISLNSTFKTWHVAGQSDLVAEGEDEITIEAGSGITLTTTPTGTKKLKIDGFSGSYSDLANKPDLTTKADLVDGKLSTSQLPNLAISEYLGDVASQSAMLAKTGQRGDWVTRTDLSEAYILIADGGSTLSDWRKIATPADSVSSVAGKTGAVTLVKGDVGLGNVDNTSDANKPVSTATQTALDLKAPLASPALTGTPTAPTAPAGTNTTQIATTAFVQSAVSAGGGGGTGVSDGDKGDIVVLNSGATWTIDSNAVTFGKIQNVSADKLLGRASASVGNIEEISCTAAGRSMLAAANAAAQKSLLSLSKSDVGLANVDNTSDDAKPISSATQTALDTKAPLASPNFTGIPLAPTAAPDTNTTQIATTAFVVSQGYVKSSAVALASQAEAEAGSNNTKLMTPLRVKQAIAAQGGGSGGGGLDSPSVLDLGSIGLAAIKSVSFGLITDSLGTVWC